MNSLQWLSTPLCDAIMIRCAELLFPEGFFLLISWCIDTSTSIKEREESSLVTPSFSVLVIPFSIIVALCFCDFHASERATDCFG